MKKVKEEVNLDNRLLLLEMYVKALREYQAGNKVALENYAEEVAVLARAGKVSEQDILSLQEEGVRVTVISDISSRLVVGPAGLTFHEAVAQGHKYQFIALSYAKQTGGDVKQTLFNTMSAMEKTIDEIYKGNYPTDKLQVLKDLPDIEHWDHDLGARAYSTIYPSNQI